MSYTTAGFLKRVMLLCASLALISCAPPAALQPPTATPPMSLADAQQIASQSASCMQVGRLKDTAVYNSNSNTWWIDLDATARGCNPACVVNVATKTAEVNWRCTGAAVPPQLMTPTSSQSANPASENCVKQGGTVSIQTRGDGGQYGVCMFEDNKQCEEWAMLRGDCPVGGIKVTAASGWFAARPSGTENIYKLYAESFLGRDHLGRILEEAQAIVRDTLAAPDPREKS